MMLAAQFDRIARRLGAIYLRRGGETIMVFFTVLGWTRTAVAPDGSFDAPAFALLAAIMPERAWGVAALACAAVAAWSLLINGAGTWRASLARVCAYLLLLVFYAALAIGLAWETPFSRPSLYYAGFAVIAFLSVLSAADEMADRAPGRAH